MPVRVTRLRVAGFKSFAEPAVVEILPGLTGIVGPNGCGKSNVVEALRWAMGENSARSLRGAEMDDVIFAGTAARPSRNIAEVSLLLEDTAGVAPPPFHEMADLEISRRIERGGGSAYRINGLEARARDVQTLFNDVATGAHSSGMVSQGRVGALVGARPEERRLLLEEAAGITGLHSRRHEAELKLRAADANLSRAEDLRLQLEAQHEGLKRQVRQANRYRTVSAALREGEAELLAIRHARAAAASEAAREAHREAEAALAQIAERADAAGRRAAGAAAALPALRANEGEGRVILERRRIEVERITADASRIGGEFAAAVARLQQVRGDLAYAEQAGAEAAASLARLANETSRLRDEDAAHPPRMSAAESGAASSRSRLDEAEAAADRAGAQAADLTARHGALTEALAQAQQRSVRLEQQEVGLRAERARVSANLVAPAALEAAETARQAAEAAREKAAARLLLAERHRTATIDSARAALSNAQQVAAARRATARSDANRDRDAARVKSGRSRADAAAEAEAIRAATHAALANAREAAAAAVGHHDRLDAEVAALIEILAVEDDAAWPPMIDQLTVPAGLEAALGAALSEELTSAADPAAARHWRDLPPLDPAPALPGGALPLAGLIAAPPALARSLSQIGLVDAATPASLARLLPGQILVTREGALWRWDGYTVKPGTASAATVRLRQRNRLAVLRAALETARQVAEAGRAGLADAEAGERAARAEADTRERRLRAEADAGETAERAAADQAERTAQAQAIELEQSARSAAERAEQAARAAETEARSARSAAEQCFERARLDAARLAEQASSATARLAGLEAQAARLAGDRAEADAGLAAAREAAGALPDLAAARTALEQARARLAACRAEAAAARAARDDLARETEARARRSRLVDDEVPDWRTRARDAASRVTDLGAREADAVRVHDALQAAPAELAGQRAAALVALDHAAAAHALSAEALAASEAEALSADSNARAAEAALAAGREQLVRTESALAQAEQAFAAVAGQLPEGPTGLRPTPSAIGAEAEERARRKLERLQRERDEMGLVNLLAEREAAEIAARMQAIARDRDELLTAIAKLRGSIGHINREGRERLAAVFADIDRHFQTLFARMFGGGRAHLAMVGSDDPLAAGLEIYAQPPGKKLATLSLLSGGEQALTALSLIFAVFRCNPAPICVLDEVDAPLDDANVGRFGTLLEDMVRETGTRFLVVTHHPTTMARMDRLYGVTMQERGVSRLLSVDLTRATALLDTGRMAAE